MKKPTKSTPPGHSFLSILSALWTDRSDKKCTKAYLGQGGTNDLQNARNQILQNLRNHAPVYTAAMFSLLAPARKKVTNIVILATFLPPQAINWANLGHSMGVETRALFLMSFWTARSRHGGVYLPQCPGHNTMVIYRYTFCFCLGTQLVFCI